MKISDRVKIRDNAPFARNTGTVVEIDRRFTMSGNDRLYVIKLDSTQDTVCFWPNELESLCAATGNS